MNRVKKNYSDPVRLFLSSVAEARIEARRLRLRIQRLETQATKLTASLTGMPRGGGDRESLLASLADTRVKCDQALVEAERKEDAVTAFINRLDNPVSRILLKLRYCDCLDWVGRSKRTVIKEMAKAGLFYSERQIRRLHGIALNEARELYKKEYGDDESRDS